MHLQTLNRRKVRHLLPKRQPDAHKGMFGKILLLCGSVGYTGAAAMAAMGALRSGAGLVFLGVPESIYAIEATKLTEAMVFPLRSENGKLSQRAIPEILKRISKMDAVLIGPGLGQSEDTLLVTQAVLTYAQCPVVLDADGINVMAAHKSILRERHYPTVLTPHDGEFRKLWQQPETDRISDAVTFAADTGCILLRKGHRTLITDGANCYENRTGNSGMATGGSGDVLSGMIVSLLGQGMAPLEAAACAAWLHGRAGDLCAKKLGVYGMLPSDLLEVLPRLMK